MRKTRTKAAVAIESDRYFGQADGQTDKHSTDFICPILCNSLDRQLWPYLAPFRWYGDE